MQHKKIILGDIHKIHNWEFLDESSRMGFVGYTSEDIGKIAWQKDNDSFWVLKDPITPTFVVLGGTNPAGDSSFSSGIVSFSETSTDMGRLMIGSVVYGAMVIIKTPFDDTSATISIGTDTNPESIVPTSEINANVAGTYHASPAYFTTTEEHIKLFINSYGSSAGEVYAKLSVGQ